MAIAAAEILFELSSDDRVKLLSEISRTKQRASQLARVSSSTVQETSRQLGRLQEAGLIERDSGGYFRLSLFGALVLRLVPSLDFVSRNREYFLAHDMSSVPEEFVERIGDLSESTFGRNAGTVFRHSEEVLSGARKYAWFLADHAVFGIGTVLSFIKDNDVTVRIVVQNIEPAGDDNAESAIRVLGDRLEIRIASQVPVAVAMNEKIAGVAFPGPGREVDYNSGFSSPDSRFRSWCSDMMEYYWARSKSVV